MQEGFEVAVACWTADAEEAARSWGVTQVYPLPLNRANFSLRHLIATSCALRRVIRHFKPDLIQTAGLRSVVIAWLGALNLISMHACTPNLVHLISGMGSLFSSKKLGFKLRCTRICMTGLLAVIARWPRNWIVCQNAGDRDWIQRTLCAPLDKLLLIPGSGIDVSQWVARPEPSDTPARIVFVGRFIEEKGLSDLVEALRLLKQRGFVYVARVIGDVDPGNPHSLKREQVIAWMNEGLIEWLGHRQDVLSCISESHVLVFPSTYGEGLPNVILEAGLAQRAIVAYDHAGARQAVEHGVSGLLVPQGNIPALADAIFQLARDSALRRKLAEAHHQRVVHEFSDSVIHAHYIGLYRRISGV